LPCLNGVLRNFLRNKSSLDISFKDDYERLGYHYSYEPWMVKMFISQYGVEDTEFILQGLNSTPNVTIRVNSLKISYEDAFKRMLDNGYEIEEGRVCPEE
jgi:16S rRNA (cytosine967-C5)-methyltransferase